MSIAPSTFPTHPDAMRTSGALSRRRLSLSLGFAVLALGLLAAPSMSQQSIVPDDGGFPARTYFRVTRPDLRLCPAPYCGGVFVEQVNRRWFRCPDKTLARECHAPFVDWSALGLDPDEEVALNGDFVAKRVIVRGALFLEDIGFGTPLTTLVVQGAWRGVTGFEPEGGFWGVVPSGIVCITFPCPIYKVQFLNRYRSRLLEGVNLSDSGATDEEIAAGFEALHDDGLIIAGRLRRITGPAGKGRELVASEFYTKVDAKARACGGYTYPPNPPCDAGEFCEPPPGTCFIADLPGVCRPQPEACPEIYDPVCGCDGQTYSNDCERRAAGVGLDHVGACGGEPCGRVTCGPGTVCCNPLMDICTPPGQFCIQ